MAGKSSNRIIYAALVGNLLVAATKFVAAGWTGSSSMLSEGVHSLVDTGNQALLLYGKKRASRPPDDEHPLGHARELYFWSFIVALLIFSLGAGVSFYEGIIHLRNPRLIEAPYVNYVVLSLSLVFEGTTWSIAYREFNSRRGDLGYFEAIERSKDPPLFVVLLEDTAATIGILIAFAGTALAHMFSQPAFDGAASIGIALLLGATAVFLARESKGLLLGEPARRQVREDILRLARAQAGIDRVSDLVTVHLGPDAIIATLRLRFAKSCSVAEAAEALKELEQVIRTRHPAVTNLFFSLD